MNTFKRFVVGVVVILVGFVTIGCATGGYLANSYVNPYSRPLGWVMQENLAMVNPMMGYGGYGSMGMGLGLGYGGYGSMGMPMGMGYGGLGNLPMSCGLGGAGVAMLANASLGKVIGAGLVSSTACQVAALAMSRRDRTQMMTMAPQGGSGPQAVRYAADGMPIAVGRPVGQAPPSYVDYQPAVTVGQPSTRPAEPREIEPTCPSGQVMFKNDTGTDVTVSAESVPAFVMIAGGGSCQNWVVGRRWDAKKHSTMATESVVSKSHSSSAVMNLTPICFEGDSRGVIHLRNTCSR